MLDVNVRGAAEVAPASNRTVLGRRAFDMCLARLLSGADRGGQPPDKPASVIHEHPSGDRFQSRILNASSIFQGMPRGLPYSGFGVFHEPEQGIPSFWHVPSNMTRTKQLRRHFSIGGKRGSGQPHQLVDIGAADLLLPLSVPVLTSYCQSLNKIHLVRLFQP